MREEKKRILKLVEQGKLSAAEALTILEQLEKSVNEQEEKQKEIVTELSTVVKYEENKADNVYQKEDSFNKKVLYAKDKLFDFVDHAIKKIKDFDLDLNFGQHHEISHIFQDSSAVLQEIEVDIANGRTEIIPWENSEVRIECQAKVYRVKDQEEARRNFIKETIFTIENGTLKFLAQQRSMKVEAKIYIPIKEYDRLHVRMFNGPISGENLNVKKMKAKTANGKITFNRIAGFEAEVETANGQITLDHCRYEKVEADTVNGAIVVNGVFNKLDLHSFNGQIQCKVHEKGCERIHAKAVTGSIEIFLPVGVSVDGDLKTNLGGFNLDLEGIEVVEEKNDVVQKLLRFKTLTNSEPKLFVFGESTSGSVSVKRDSF